MKKYLSCVLAMVIILSSSVRSFAASSDLMTKRRVAVAEFSIRQNSVVHGREAREFARTATEKIVNAFAELKRFTLLDRAAVLQLQQEKQIRMLGKKTKSAKAKPGAAGKVDIYCSGEVQNVSVTPKYDSKGKFLGYDGDVELQIWMYDLSTGALVLSKDVRGGTEMGGGILSVLSLYQDTPSKAVFKALNNVERRIKDAIAEAFPVEGKIVEVIDASREQEMFLTTMGSEFGFSNGDKLTVIETTMLHVDGVSVPHQREIGQLEITKVEPDGTFSEARVTGDGGQIIVGKFTSGANLVLRSVR